MKRLFATLGILILPTLGCDLEDAAAASIAAVTPTPPRSLEPTRTSLPFSTPQQPTQGQHLCGYGLRDVAEQADIDLCPVGCPESGGAPPAPVPTILPATITSAAPLQPTHVMTHEPLGGTHRPEILVNESEELCVVVVQPESRRDLGQAKHQAIRFCANWNQLGEPSVVTHHAAEYGEPADHRTAPVSGELVVVYHNLSFEDESPPQGATGPTEQYAKHRSLPLARFSMDGTEFVREPIVAQAVKISRRASR